jgi:solute carrier family 25 protein 33/36
LLLLIHHSPTISLNTMPHAHTQSSLYKAPTTPGPATTPGGAPRGWLHPLRSAGQHVVGVVDILRSIKEREGVRALWKGLGPNLLGVVPARAIYFATYSQGKHLYTSLNHGQETPVIHMLSAATASTATSIGTSPIWLVKTRMQLQSEDPTRQLQRTYRNSLHCAYVVVKTEGIQGLYKGLSASLLGMGESALQFAIYEYLKKEILSLRQERWRTRHPAQVPLHPEPPVALGWMDTFGTAAVAKLFAAAVTYPHEVRGVRGICVWAVGCGQEVAVPRS